MNLAQDAMLTRLATQSWTGHVRDRNASRFTASGHNAQERAGTYIKSLLPDSNLRRIRTAISNARKAHYENTLPWDDNGDRLLPVDNYEHYVASIRGSTDKMVALRTEFITKYDEYVARARLSLGRLFNPDDYPLRTELLGRFTIHYTIRPVPQSGHFLADIPDADTIRNDIEHRVEQQMQTGLTDLYHRIGEAIGHVHDRLGHDADGKPNVFRDSMIANLRELVDVSGRLNLFGNQGIELLRKEIDAKLASYDAELLRTPGPLRDQAREDAKTLMDKCAGYFAAVSAPPTALAA